MWFLKRFFKTNERNVIKNTDNFMQNNKAARFTKVKPKNFNRYRTVAEQVYLQILIGLLTERFNSNFISHTDQYCNKRLTAILNAAQRKIDSNVRQPYIHVMPSASTIQQVVTRMQSHYYVKSISRKLYNKHYVKK